MTIEEYEGPKAGEEKKELTAVQNLVWSGFGPSGGGIYHNFHVCPINGTDYLCYFNGNQYLGYARGHGVVMDNTLSYHASVQAQGGIMPNDEHEFNVVDDGQSVLISIYETLQHDLTDYNITEGQGWMINNWFQKVHIATNELLFEWSAADFVPITDTYIKPNSTDVSGTGLSPFSPFDWFHINSIDSFPNGDYLVSGRHVSTIYRVSGQDGSIIWQLGGVSSDFSFAPGVNFSFQHDARLRFQNETTTIISIFDNASNGFNQSSRYSAGKILALDHTTNTCSLLREFVAPLQFISPSQGNVQMLSPTTVASDPTSDAWQTSNFFLGWGANAFVSEYLADGTEIFRGHFATSGTMNYRAFKHNYTTNPTDAPASYVYAHNDSAPTVFYMSWNGATKAARWRVHVSDNKAGPYRTIATVTKEGFETIYTSPHYHAWSIIESLDQAGNHLRNSTRPTRTFVPSRTLAESCNELECPVVNQYNPPTGGGGGSGSAQSSSPHTNAARSNIAARVAERSRWGNKLSRWLTGGVCTALAGMRI